MTNTKAKSLDLLEDCFSRDLPLVAIKGKNDPIEIQSQIKIEEYLLDDYTFGISLGEKEELCAFVIDQQDWHKVDLDSPEYETLRVEGEKKNFLIYKRPDDFQKMEGDYPAYFQPVLEGYIALPPNEPDREPVFKQRKLLPYRWYQSEFDDLDKTDLNFTTIPNYYIDQVMPRVEPNAWKMFCLILRKTLGYEKESNPTGRKQKDWISLSQFKEKCGIGSENTVIKNREELERKGLIDIEKSIISNKIFYRANTPTEIEEGEGNFPTVFSSKYTIRSTNNEHTKQSNNDNKKSTNAKTGPQDNGRITKLLKLVRKEFDKDTYQVCQKAKHILDNENSELSKAVGLALCDELNIKGKASVKDFVSTVKKNQNQLVSFFETYYKVKDNIDDENINDPKRVFFSVWHDVK